MGAPDIKTYLQANYCPTVEDQEACVEDLSRYYIGMLVGATDSGLFSDFIICLSDSSVLLSTTVLVELFTCARPWGLVMQEGEEKLILLKLNVSFEGTLARSAWKD